MSHNQKGTTLEPLGIYHIPFMDPYVVFWGPTSAWPLGAARSRPDLRLHGPPASGTESHGPKGPKAQRLHVAL